MTELSDMGTRRKAQLRLFDVARWGGGRRATSQLELEHLMEHGELGSLHPIEPEPIEPEWRRVARELRVPEKAQRLVDRYRLDEGLRAAAHGFGYEISFDALCPEPKQAEVERWLRHVLAAETLGT